MMNRNNLFNSLIGGKHNNPDSVVRWNVNCSDGKHRIAVRLGATMRDGKKLYIDEEYVAAILYTEKSIIPKQEYEFECGGDKLILVTHSNKIDLVHNGMLQTAKIAYDNKSFLPIWIRVALVILTLISAMVLPICNFKLLYTTDLIQQVLAISMSVASALILMSSLSNPFIAKTKRILYSILCVAWSWGLQFLILGVFAKK